MTTEWLAWMSTLTNVWGGISDGKFGAVQSFGPENFPAAINPKDDFPLALTYIPSLDPTNYGVSAPKIAVWEGSTEFHVAPDLDITHYAELKKWYGLIWQAAASNPTLGGAVELFWLYSRPDAISRPLGLQYGDEAPHWGFIVNWRVKERVTITVSI